MVRPASKTPMIASGIVWVRPWKLPAKISVAPSSPRARAQQRMAPASTDGHDSGRTMRQKMRSGLAPSVAATPSYCSSTLAKPVFTVRM